jgi:hypothetical protein
MNLNPAIMKIYYLLSLTFLTFVPIYGQVGINTITPGRGAILDVTATDKGVLLPRVVLTSTIIDLPVDKPESGVLVFNTNTAGTGETAVSPGYYFWDDDQKEWMRFTSGEQGNHYVGELFGGGVVFYVYENGSHGLIASFDDLDLGIGVKWGPTYLDTNSESWWDGETNNDTAMLYGPLATDAVALCDAFNAGGFTDWHLPSIGELKALEDAAYVLFKVLDSDGDPTTNGPDYNDEYWSSTTNGNIDAYSFKFTNTHTEISGRGQTHRVRAVRAF